MISGDKRHEFDETVKLVTAIRDFGNILRAHLPSDVLGELAPLLSDEHCAGWLALEIALPPPATEESPRILKRPRAKEEEEQVPMPTKHARTEVCDTVRKLPEEMRSALHSIRSAKSGVNNFARDCEMDIGLIPRYGLMPEIPTAEFTEDERPSQYEELVLDGASCQFASGLFRSVAKYREMCSYSLKNGLDATIHHYGEDVVRVNSVFWGNMRSFTLAKYIDDKRVIYVPMVSCKHYSFKLTTEQYKVMRDLLEAFSTQILAAWEKYQPDVGVKTVEDLWARLDGWRK